jgi:hypothetical protein
VLGFLAAAAGTTLWTVLSRGNGESSGEWREIATQVDLFRLPSTDRREMFLVPAGPNAEGEPLLAKALFPGEEPPRELASLLLANVSPDEPWAVDLETKPLSCRRVDDDVWRPITGVAPSTAADGPRLTPTELLRLRGLGAGVGKTTVEPRSLRRVLLALPPNCRLSDLSDVQWDGVPLVRDQLELERVRRFREDPAGATIGR